MGGEIKEITDIIEISDTMDAHVGKEEMLLITDKTGTFLANVLFVSGEEECSPYRKIQKKWSEEIVDLFINDIMAIGN